MVKNDIIFGAYVSSSVHVDNKGKDILILGKCPAQGLDDTTLSAEAQHSTNFSRSKGTFSVCIIMGTTVFYLLMLQDIN